MNSAIVTTHIKPVQALISQNSSTDEARWAGKPSTRREAISILSLWLRESQFPKGGILRRSAIFPRAVGAAQTELSGKRKKKKEKSSKLGGKGWLLRGADGVNMFKMDYNEILGELIKIVF